jgi:signal transduction histidine kinase
MRLRLPKVPRPAGPRRPGWPARTVRTRLTLLYCSLFVVSAGVLLAIVGVLWGSSTPSTISVEQPVPLQVLLLTGLAPPGVLHAGGTVGGASGGGAVVTGNSGAVQSAGQSATGTSGAAPTPVRAAVVRSEVVEQLQLLASEQHSSDLRHLLLWSGLALGGMALLSVALGWLTAGRVLRPLHRITRAARDISASNLHERLSLEGPVDEFKELGDTFDQLLERLDGAFESQRRFVANASHELRTPLATMRAAIDVALAKPQPIPEQTVVLAGHLRQELDEVEQLLESFLLLARAQAGAIGDPDRVALATLVRSAVSAQAPASAASGLDVRVDVEPSVEVAGNPTLLACMVENLVDNAVRHNEPGGWVRVRCAADGETALLTVENGGVVVDGAALEELGQPFRRLAPDRTASVKGSGLGLSIVRSIAEAHHGGLELRAVDGGGFGAAVRLPRLPQGVERPLVGATT